MLLKNKSQLIHNSNSKKGKQGFMFIESIIGLSLIGAMVFLLVINQQMQLENLRRSERALGQSREQFHQLNAVQFGASIHEGIEINLEKGKLEDQRDGHFTEFKIQE
ncbi:hypothetical protein ACNMZ4_01125 [Aerococcus urinaeequi]|uniref:hypothetical protein n=1 Tax=Aerococcus urinaeequi TaxID=51665 RepID=UPI003AAB69B4